MLNDSALLSTRVYLGVLCHGISQLDQDYIAAYRARVSLVGEGLELTAGAVCGWLLGARAGDALSQLTQNSFSTSQVLHGIERIVIWENQQDFNRYSESELLVQFWKPQESLQLQFKALIIVDTPRWFCENQVKIHFPFLRE